MSLFKPAEMTNAYLKMGIFGLAGSGKTYTASDIAIGLIRYMKERGVPGHDKPVFFLDTEGGVSWIKPKLDSAGIQLMSHQSRSCADLWAAVHEAEQNASVFIIDSITHFWTEFCDSYAKVKNRRRGLEFQDWAYLKREWRTKYTEPYLNTQLHIIQCGRAGFEYEHFVDEAGKKQLEKTGVKMKSEGESGFEPSLLVYMERDQNIDDKSIDHVAHVMKDRRGDDKTLDGKSIRNPKFAHFLPHIEYLNLGGRQLGVDTSRNSEHTIPRDDRDNTKVQREICLDEIQSLLVSKYPGQSAADKKTKVDLLTQHFQASWTEMEKVMPLSDLRAGFNSLHIELEGGPSRYGEIVKAAPEMNDSIPDFEPADTSDPKADPKAFLEGIAP